MVLCSDEAMYTVDDKMLHTLAYTLAYLFGLPLVLWILRLLGSKRASSRELRAIHERVSMRMRLTMLLYVQTRVGLYWEIVQSGAAFLSCLFYIMSTYDDDCLPLGSRTFELAAEIGLGAVFALDYALNFYLADDKLGHCFKLITIVDVLTVLPIVMQYSMHGIGLVGCESADSFMYIKFVRLVRVLRVLRALRPLSRMIGMGSPDAGVWPHVITIIVIVLVIVLVASCLFHYVETLCIGEASALSDGYSHDLSFHLIMYWMIIEVLGRPRIPVGSWAGCVVLVAVVIVVVVLIPAQLVRLFEALQQDSV